MSAPRVAVITGASSGIGRAVAHRMARDGDDLVLAARGRQGLETAAQECRAAGARSVLVVPTDVRSDDEVAACIQSTLSQFDRIDAIVHCAGVVSFGRTEDVPPEVFGGVLETNVMGSVNIARHGIVQMRRQGHGSLVLLGSVIGHIAVPSMSPYVLSKWGVRALARQLQIENRDMRDVTVAYVAPAGVDTPIYEHAANYSGYDGRPPPPVASPERVANVVVAQIGRRRARRQTGVANDLMRFGFNATPWLFDILIGPAARLLTIDWARPVADTSGNVLTSRDTANRLRGRHRNAFLDLGRALASRVSTVARPPA